VAVEDFRVEGFLGRVLGGQDLAPAGGLPTRLSDFVTVVEGGEIVAAATVWDQRGVRQFAVTRYPGLVRVARPLLNVLAGVMGRPGLPRIGSPLNLAYVSRLALGSHEPRVFLALLRGLAVRARGAGIDYLVLSLPVGHSLRVTARRLAAYVTPSTLYAVHWAEDPGPPALSGLPYVEAALL
jgi:hypothetical protein